MSDSASFSRFAAMYVAGVVALACAAFACTSTSTGTGSSSSGGTSGSGEPLAANCNSRCEAKAAQCQAADPAGTCSELCSLKITESQATCLENSDCQALAGNDLPCGIGATTSSSSGGSSGGGSSSGSTTSSSGSSTKTDPPGSPCGDANGGVNDCAPIGCKCNDGTSTFPASVCTNGSCADKSDFCPGVCKSKGGWSGS